MRDTIDMAREAGIVFDDRAAPFYERFAALVRADAIADEREACATVCEKMRSETPIGKTSRIEALFFAARAIRARGNT
jgi:hypothetical protein